MVFCNGRVRVSLSRLCCLYEDQREAPKSHLDAVILGRAANECVHDDDGRIDIDEASLSLTPRPFA